MTQETIALVVGGIVSVALEIIPGLRDFWSKWEWRRVSLLGLFLAVPIVAWSLVCTAGLSLPGTYTCTTQGAFDAAILGLVAFAGSQTTYLVITRQSANARLRHVCVSEARD